MTAGEVAGRGAPGYVGRRGVRAGRAARCRRRTSSCASRSWRRRWSGVLMARHVLRLEPLASMPVDDVVALVGADAAALPDRSLPARSPSLPGDRDRPRDQRHLQRQPCPGDRRAPGPAAGVRSRADGHRHVAREDADQQRGRRHPPSRRVGRAPSARRRTRARRRREPSTHGSGSPSDAGDQRPEDAGAGAGAARPTCPAGRRARRRGRDGGGSSESTRHRSRAAGVRCRVGTVRRWTPSTSPAHGLRRRDRAGVGA